MKEDQKIFALDTLCVLLRYGTYIAGGVWYKVEKSIQLAMEILQLATYVAIAKELYNYVGCSCRLSILLDSACMLNVQ